MGALRTIGIISFAFFASIALLIRLQGEDPELQRDLKVVVESPTIDKLLEPYKEQIGDDYDGYRGHLLRVYTYLLHFLGGADGLKLEGVDESVVPLALVYHDLGLWSDSRLDYLEPSAERALADYGEHYSEEEKQLIYDLIYWHHKITPFEGPHERLVNAFRRADWIDASQGMVRFGMPKSHVIQTEQIIPNNGFHQSLLEIGPKIRGWNFFRIITELGTIFKW